MKIAYKKKHLYINLILGLVWFAIGAFGKKELDWTDYVLIFLSLLYLGMFFYQMKYQYLTIDNGIINVKGPFGKKLYLTKINQIKKFAGDYILKTDNKELTINTQKIDAHSLSKLDVELEKLNVEWS